MPLPSKRDPEWVRTRLLDWLGTRLAPDAKPSVSALDVPSGNGMSSETFLFETRWTEDGREREGRYVARMSPDMNDCPVFPEYDLSLQVDCLGLVAERSDVPVPRVAWFEPDEGPLGAPFYVMERIDGEVPNDLPPYPFGGWLFDASAQERARFQRATLSVLARLHAIDVGDASFLDRPQYGADPLEQHLAYQRAYYDWAREGARYPVLEKTFEWLEAHRPDDRRPAGLNWGDARIGNILYRDFEPVAVLDWEMAALGAPEVDLAWMCAMNDFFQAMAEGAGQPGLPDLLRHDEVIEGYESLTGHRVEHFEWYWVFAALRFGIVSIRTSMRAIAYGQLAEPPTRDEYIMNRILLQPYVA